MSSSIAIAIPSRRKKTGGSSSSVAGATPSSSSTPSFPSTPNSYGGFGSPASNSTAASPLASFEHMRRPSLMSPAFTKTEHTVINIGNSETPRLITCVKASQGFDWNQEIFLPSYADYHFQDLETKKDPVQDIFVSDEEVANMFPS